MLPVPSDVEDDQPYSNWQIEICTNGQRLSAKAIEETEEEEDV